MQFQLVSRSTLKDVVEAGQVTRPKTRNACPCSPTPISSLLRPRLVAAHHLLAPARLACALTFTCLTPPRAACKKMHSPLAAPPTALTDLPPSTPTSMGATPLLVDSTSGRLSYSASAPPFPTPSSAFMLDSSASLTPLATRRRPSQSIERWEGLLASGGVAPPVLSPRPDSPLALAQTGPGKSGRRTRSNSTAGLALPGAGLALTQLDSALGAVALMPAPLPPVVPEATAAPPTLHIAIEAASPLRARPPLTGAVHIKDFAFADSDPRFRGLPHPEAARLKSGRLAHSGSSTSSFSQSRQRHSTASGREASGSGAGGEEGDQVGHLDSGGNGCKPSSLALLTSHRLTSVASTLSQSAGALSPLIRKIFRWNLNRVQT